MISSHVHSHTEAMRSVRGNARLPLENDSSAVSIHPNYDPRRSKFSEPSRGNERNYHDKQSKLELIPPRVPPYTFHSHNHCIISAYGSTANPTSTHLVSSSNVSQWRSLARWETNVADLLPTVPHTDAPEMSVPARTLYESDRSSGQYATFIRSGE